jgi:NADPH2:quinone reductase
VGTGERVAWAGPMGSYAERVALPAAAIVPVPDALTDEQAAGALLQGMTAHAFVVDAFPVQAGQDVLIHAAAGGLGLQLTQLASARGARVIGTVSTPEKAELARAAGAAEIVNYSEIDDVAAAVRELTGGTGVHVVYDGVGATTFDASLASLRARGMLVLCGAASGPVPPFDPQRLNAAGSLFLTRPKLNDYVATREELLARAEAVLGAVADGTLDVRIGGRYPLEDVRRAHEDLEGRRTTGKLLLIP